MTKPRVKKLEWQSLPLLGVDGQSSRFYLAATALSTLYTVQMDRTGEKWGVLFDDDDEPFSWCGSVQEGQAAAQADYERRILSALEDGDD